MSKGISEYPKANGSNCYDSFDSLPPPASRKMVELEASEPLSKPLRNPIA